VFVYLAFSLCLFRTLVGLFLLPLLSSDGRLIDPRDSPPPPPPPLRTVLVSSLLI